MNSFYFLSDARLLVLADFIRDGCNCRRLQEAGVLGKQRLNLAKQNVIACASGFEEGCARFSRTFQRLIE
jgi:hypothetical protein